MRSDCSYILVDESVYILACKASSASKTLNHIEPDAGMAFSKYIYTVLFRLHCPTAHFTLTKPGPLLSYL